MAEEASFPKGKTRYACNTVSKYTTFNTHEKVDMDQIYVKEYFSALTTKNCGPCAALIIVAQTNNGELWHGLYHSSTISTSGEINNSFNCLEKELMRTIHPAIVTGVDYYLITSPHFKTKRTNDANASGFGVTVYAPVVSHPVRQIDHDTYDVLHDEISVKLTNGLIEVIYYDIAPETICVHCGAVIVDYRCSANCACHV